MDDEIRSPWIIQHKSEFDMWVFEGYPVHRQNSVRDSANVAPPFGEGSCLNKHHPADRRVIACPFPNSEVHNMCKNNKIEKNQF